VLTCLEKIPDRRFSSMDALLAALEQIEPAAATPPPATAAAGMSTAAAPATAGLLARLTGRLRHAVRPAAADAVEEIKAWIAARQKQRQPRFRIVVALDHDGGARGEALNRSLLAAALRQSALQPTSITLVTVLRDYNATMADERERQELNAASQATRERMARLVAELDSADLSVGINVRSGDPIAAIAGCVADYEADLLIIGARERNALSRFVLGSTAYKVLTTIKCPVFVVQETVAKARRPGHAATPAAGDVRPAAARVPASIRS
jgi:nucleotide-binding universal stress UspA family protein